MQLITENAAPSDSGDKPEFRKALEHAINYHSMESGSSTPDFVLAQYLADCLTAFDKAVTHRGAWYGRGRVEI
jgi:hypothetical protein